MTRNGWIWVLTTALALTGVATPVRAQQISEARIRELIKQAAVNVVKGNPEAQAPQPGSGARPVVRLTLDDAVKFALDKNLSIAVQRLNPEINDITVASYRSVYLPSITSTISTQSTSTPANSTLTGGSAAGSSVVAGLNTYNGGLAQSIPWGGGNLSVALNNNKQTTTSLNTLYNPAYNTLWSGVYMQPLMRGFRTDPARQALQVTKLNRDISDVQLRATITNTLSNVRNAYWNYVYSVQAVDVAKQSVDLGDQLVKDNQTRVEVGTMAPIDVIQAQSQAATARQNLVAAQSTMYTAELALKTLIVGGTQDPNWNAKLDPIDRPDFQAQPIDIDAAVRRALSERTDLDIAKKNMQQNDATLAYLQDLLRPQADLIATYGLAGLGGTQLVKSNTSVNSTATSTIPGGYADALSTLLGNNFPRWTAQVNFSYPLGLSAQKASVARARVQQSQVLAQVRQIELQVATDVTNAAVTAQTSIERVQAAQSAREFAQKTMEAEQSKFEVGMSTNYNVILTQRDLATAQINELQAILLYRQSLVELERLQQTTLTSLGITVISPTQSTALTGG